MGKGLAIASLVLAILALVVPVVGIYIAWLGLCLVTVAALCGERPLTIATVVISAVNIFFLSPSFWIVHSEAQRRGMETPGLILTVVLLIAPVAALLLHASGKLVLAQRGPSSKA